MHMTKDEMRTEVLAESGIIILRKDKGVTSRFHVTATPTATVCGELVHPLVLADEQTAASVARMCGVCIAETGYNAAVLAEQINMTLANAR